MAGKRGRPKKSLRDKLKDIDPYFLDEVDGMPKDQVEAKVVSLTKYREEVETAQKADEDLKSARAKVKTINETYTVPLRANKMKLQYLLQRLAEQGS